MKRFILFVFLFSPFSILAQQQFEQKVRGVVVEKNTQESLPGAAVIVSSSGKEYAAVSNERGEFAISGIQSIFFRESLTEDMEIYNSDR